MCFVEYIGYTCGHTSVKVQRPCPLTTHLHNNPACPSPAERPFTMPTMCPACTRILHGRWVNIMEYEHRWMHERGTCNCPVEFPSMQHPREIQTHSVMGSSDSSSASHHGSVVGSRGGVSGATGGRGALRNGTKGPSPRRGGIKARGGKRPTPRQEHDRNAEHYSTREGRHRQPRPKRGGRRKQGLQRVDADPADMPIAYPVATTSYGNMNAFPPLFQEKTTTIPRAGIEDNMDENPFKVSIRLPSMFATEWTQDHAKLHESGKCRCPVDFSKYKPGASLRGDSVDFQQQPVYDEAEWHHWPATNVPDTLQQRHNDPEYQLFSSPFAEAYQYGPRLFSNTETPPPPAAPKAQIAGLPSSEDTTTADASPGNFAPVFQQQDSLSSSSSSYSYCCDQELHERKHHESPPSRLSFFSSHQSAVAAAEPLSPSPSLSSPSLPIAGFPIGAGPEGSHPHAREFDARCELQDYIRRCHHEQVVGHHYHHHRQEQEQEQQQRQQYPHQTTLAPSALIHDHHASPSPYDEPGELACCAGGGGGGGGAVVAACSSPDSWPDRPSNDDDEGLSFMMEDMALSRPAAAAAAAVGGSSSLQRSASCGDLLGKL